MDTIVVETDVSKEKLAMVVRPRGEVFGPNRDAHGLDALIARLAPLAPEAVAVEATGGFESVVVNRPRSVPLPKRLGKRAKTDPIDAIAIAHFAEATKPDIRPLPDEAARLLSELVARRRQIVQIIAAERKPQRRLDEKQLQEEHARLIKGPEMGLSTLDRCIDDAVRRSPEGPRERRFARLGAGRRPGCLVALIGFRIWRGASKKRLGTTMSARQSRC